MKASFSANSLPDIIEVIKKYVKPGQDYVLELCQKRTLDQNAYYRGVIISCFSDCTGYSKEKAHNILAKRFLSEFKENKWRVRSTTELTTIEFEQYLSSCKLYLHHDFRCPVPDPNQVTDELIFELEKVYNL